MQWDFAMLDGGEMLGYFADYFAVYPSGVAAGLHTDRITIS